MSCRRVVLFLVSLALLSIAPSARANDLPLVIMLVDEVEAQPQLLDALRIQLAGRAQVRSQADTSDPAIVTKSQTASAVLGATGARLVIWMEPAKTESAPDATLLHLVGDREGRVLVLVHTVEAGEQASTHRALALKVAEIFDLLETVRAEAIARAIQTEPPKAPAPAASEAVQRGDATTLHFVGDIGGWGATGTGTAPPQGAVSFGAGGRLRHESLVADLVLTGRVATTLEHSDPNGAVEADEGAFGTALRVAGAWSVVALGAEAGIGGRALAASGESPRGRHGAGDTVVPYLALAPQATFALTSFMELRATIGAEIALRRHRFLVNDVAILDVGTVRGVASGSFVFVAP
jgi:hypothetical protein